MERSNDEIEIELLLESIRQSINREQLSTNSYQQTLFDPTAFDKIPAEFLNHLLEANRINNSLQPAIEMHKPRIPIIGGLIDWLRRQAHQLVVYYVSSAVERQNKINMHLLKSAFLLGQYHAMTSPQSDPFADDQPSD